MGHQQNPQQAPKTRPVLRTAVSLLLAATIIGFAWPLMSMYQQSRASEIRGLLRTWCRLGPYPVEHQALGIEVKGNAMTQNYDYAFTASPEQIKVWQAQSPGVKDASRMDKEGKAIFKIKPYRAQRCDVSIDEATGRIQISASGP